MIAAPVSPSTVRSPRSEAELRLLPRLPGQPLAEGARHVHAGDRREDGRRAGRDPRVHLLWRRRRARGAARVLPAPERPHPRPGRAARAGDHPHDLQCLHAQPAPGRPQAEGRLGAPRAREQEPARRRSRLVRGRRRGAPPAVGDRRGRGLREAEADRPEAAHRRQDRAVLRLPDPAPVEAARVRGPRPAAVARAHHRGLWCRAGGLPVQDQVLRLPDRPGPRGGRPGRAHPAAGRGQGGRRRRDGDAVPALPPLARRLAGEGEPRGRHRVRAPDLPPRPAGRRGRRPLVRRPALQAPRHQDAPGDGQDLRGGRLERGQTPHRSPWHPRNTPVTPSYAALFRAPYTALMVAALGATFLGSLDALMVTTALPSAAQDIGGVDLIAVTVGATTVAVAMTFPVAGAVIDRESVGRSFAIACSLFAVANVLGGLAPSMPVIAVSRAILGLGAGFMFAVPLGLFAVSLPDELRPRAFGINAAMWGVSALIGPALGAVLTATVGWRWVFWINLPLIACVASSAARALRVVPPPERPARDAPLNIVGPALLGLVVAVLLALTKHWLPPLALAPVALVPAVAFVLHERRTSQPVF